MSDKRSQYAELLQALLPPGRAFNRLGSAESILGGLLHILAGELARVDTAAEQLFTEALPSTAVSTMALHEQDLGLPDPCLQYYTALIKDLKQRRIQAVEKYTRAGSMLPSFYEQLVEDLYDGTVISHVREYGEWDEGDRVVEIAPPYAAPIYSSDFSIGRDNWAGSSDSSWTGAININADGIGVPPSNNWLRIRTEVVGECLGWTANSGILADNKYKVTFDLFVETGSPIRQIKVVGRTRAPWTNVDNDTFVINAGRVNSFSFIGVSPSDVLALIPYNTAGTTVFALGTRWYIQNVTITPYTEPRYEKTFFLTSLFQWVLLMVYPDRPELIRFGSGTGRAGDNLQYTPADRPVACLLDENKPAHTQAFVVSGNPFSSAFSAFEYNALRLQRGEFSPGFTTAFDCIPGGYSDVDYAYWFGFDPQAVFADTPHYFSDFTGAAPWWDDWTPDVGLVVLVDGVAKDADGPNSPPSDDWLKVEQTDAFDEWYMSISTPNRTTIGGWFNVTGSIYLPVGSLVRSLKFLWLLDQHGKDIEIPLNPPGNTTDFSVVGIDDSTSGLGVSGTLYLLPGGPSSYKGPAASPLPTFPVGEVFYLKDITIASARPPHNPDIHGHMPGTFGMGFAAAFRRPMDVGAFSDAFTDAFRIRNLSFWIPWRGSFNNQAFAFGFNHT